MYKLAAACKAQRTRAGEQALSHIKKGRHPWLARGEKAEQRQAIGRGTWTPAEDGRAKIIRRGRKTEEGQKEEARGGKEEAEEARAEAEPVEGGTGVRSEARSTAEDTSAAEGLLIPPPQAMTSGTAKRRRLEARSTAEDTSADEGLLMPPPQATNSGAEGLLIPPPQAMNSGTAKRRRLHGKQPAATQQESRYSEGGGTSSGLFFASPLHVMRSSAPQTKRRRLRGKQAAAGAGAF